MNVLPYGLYDSNRTKHIHYKAQAEWQTTYRNPACYNVSIYMYSHFRQQKFYSPGIDTYKPRVRHTLYTQCSWDIEWILSYNVFVFFFAFFVVFILFYFFSFIFSFFSVCISLSLCSFFASLSLGLSLFCFSQQTIV